MKRFRYRLQTALDAAAEAEREAHVECAEAQRVLDDEAAALAALDARRPQGDFRTGTPAVAGYELAALDRALDAFAAARISRSEAVARSRRRVEEARARLLHASRERSALERHRARKLVEFELEAEREEARELDEASMLRPSRSTA